MQNPATQLALGTTDVVGSATEAVVERVVGEIHIHLTTIAVSAAATWIENVYFLMGIYVGDVDGTGGVIVRDPASATDMNNKDWLWRGMFSTNECNLNGNTTFTCQTNAGQDMSANSGSHIDVKVKRKIHPEEDLILSIHGLHDDVLNSAQAAFTAKVYANIRVLVSYT